jgi:hypothetical protein
VARLRQDSAYQKELPYVEADSCFRPFAITSSSSILLCPRPCRSVCGSICVGATIKSLEESPSPPVPQWANIEVLEYTSAEAASATKQVLDSLVTTCNGRNQKLEPCVVYKDYRFTRVGACLVRFNFYNQDPYQRRSLQVLASRLPLVPLRPAPAAAGHGR